MKEPENLTAFRARTERFIYDSLPQGDFETGAGLRVKVGPDGGMEPFMGNTVVFPLPETAKEDAARIQERLYRTCAPVLAEPLGTSSFHTTLHDLLNGKPSRELERRIKQTRDAALACLRKIGGKHEMVRLHSTALFNMVNTSMVLGFAPADEESCGRLMAYYEMLQEIVCLNDPLTPHVTLAYFRPGTVSAEWTDALRSAVDDVGHWKEFSVEFSTEALEYQVFSDMNHYLREL